MSKNSQAEHQCLRNMTEHSELVDLDDLDPDDDEIIGLVMETFGMDQTQAVDRLARIDFTAARSE